VSSNPHALTGAYLLDALDDAERAEFEAHLAACEDCRAEVSSLEEAVVRMAMADAVTPPPAMREAVMASIARTPQAPPGAAEPGRLPDGVTRLSGRRRRRASWPTVAAVAAALVVAVAGGTTLANDRRHVLEVEAMQATVMRIMSAPDAVSHDVDLGAAHAVMSAEMGAVALMGQDVPMPAGQGVVYQVWMMHDDGTSAPGPTFMPEHGDVTTVVKGDLSDVHGLMVTIEPSGGSSTPSGAAVTTIEL